MIRTQARQHAGGMPDRSGPPSVPRRPREVPRVARGERGAFVANPLRAASGRPVPESRGAINSGVSHFQSCGDECAERFAAAQADGEFPCFGSFIDVFYGDAQQVRARVPEWVAAFRRARSPPRKRRRGEPKPRAKQPTLLDRSPLRDAGRRAGDFMRAVRALPHFNPSRERKMVRAGPALVVEDGDLLASEARVLEETALCAQDWLDVALVLRRSLASGVAQNVLRFVAKCPIHARGRLPRESCGRKKKGCPSICGSMAPRGRPPAGYTFSVESGMWINDATGQPFDPRLHAALVDSKKRACQRRLYWDRGGRQQRLDRYVRKRKPKAKQSTLVELACPSLEAQTSAGSTISCPPPPPA